ncbi:MAG: substrate-binding periplasmic protein [Iodobacter sp.]
MLFFTRLMVLLCLSSSLLAAELRVLVLSGDDMPWMQVRGDQLAGGIYYDLGHALAEQMGRTPKFVILPRKRLVHAITSGDADLICNYLPVWLPGDFDWSLPFIPNAELLISDLRFSKPSALAGFSHERIGTVLGYVYAELDQALAGGFIRDDAPTMRHNLLKMTAGRIHHLVINQFELEYQQRQGIFKTPLHPYTVLRSFAGQCAVSRAGQVTVGQVNQAINALQAKHALRRLMERYR